MLDSRVLAICALGAFVVCGATTDSSHPAGTGQPIRLESVVLKGACSARDSFVKVIKDIQGDPEAASYLRDIGNYRVTIEVIDAEQVRVTFEPAPRSEHQISMGGGAIYRVDRRTGNLREVTLEE